MWTYTVAWLLSYFVALKFSVPWGLLFRAAYVATELYWPRFGTLLLLLTEEFFVITNSKLIYRITQGFL